MEVKTYHGVGGGGERLRQPGGEGETEAASSTCRAGRAGFLPAEAEIRSMSPPDTKISSKWIQGPHLPPETPRFLEGSLGNALRGGR